MTPGRGDGVPGWAILGIMATALAMPLGVLMPAHTGPLPAVLVALGFLAYGSRRG